jgi:hypothetical protein
MIPSARMRSRPSASARRFRTSICIWSFPSSLVRAIRRPPLEVPISKYHSSHVDVVTFVNTLQRVARFVKSALVVGNVRLRGLVSWKDYNVFARVFQSTAEALCFVKRLANFFMTMSHLVFSFVPIISQPTAPGFSALTGYGGRCTARTVPKETKKNSPIIIAMNASFMTAGGMVDAFSFSSSFYGSD